MIEAARRLCENSVCAGMVSIYYQQQQLNCFTVRTFEPEIGFRVLYREWYFEYDRCMNARKKLEKKFDEL